jgi:hypothetical protein
MSSSVDAGESNPGYLAFHQPRFAFLMQVVRQQIVFAEVIEHLFTAPELVLAYLHELLVPRGQLLLQTPNAASLRKRLKLALGRNPF